jgi:hypothetical protein
MSFARVGWCALAICCLTAPATALAQGQPPGPPASPSPATPAQPPAQPPAPDPTTVPYLDVVYTTTGSVWRGVIVEQVPNKHVRIELPGGSVVVVPANEVQRITKEPNPLVQPAAAPAPAPGPGYPPPGPGGAAPAAGAVQGGPPGGQPLPPPVATTGFRAWFGLGLALPTGDFGAGDVINTSGMLVARIGKEIMSGHMGVMPAGRLEAVYWSNDLSDEFGQDISLSLIHVGADCRLAGHIGSTILYGALGGGIDVSLNDVDMLDNGVGFGLNIDVGADFLINPGMAVGAALTIHPGYTDFADFDTGGLDVSIPDVTFMGLLGSISVY